MLSKQPLLLFAMSFIAGIVAQDYFNLDKLCLFLFFLLVFSLYLFQNFKKFRLSKFTIYILVFAFGMLIHAINSKVDSLNLQDGKRNLVFELKKKLNSNEKFRKYEVDFYENNTKFQSVLNVPKEYPELDFKNTYQAEVFVKKVEKPVYDFQFNYQKYLARKGIFYVSYFQDGLRFSAKKMNFEETVSQKRLEMLRNINDSSISTSVKQFLKGIILADRTEMNSDLVTDFNRSGLTHFLAISGTHVIIIFGLIMWMFTAAFPAKFRKIAIVLSVVLIWGFAGFIGWGNSVVRSCIMLTVYIIFELLERKPDLLHSLSLSALIILIINSQELFDVGFQLSFMAFLGIYWLNQPILDLLPFPRNIFTKIIYNTLSMTLSAQFSTLPIVLHYFHQFSFISFVSNIFIVPLSEIVIIFSLLMTFVSGFGIDFSLLNSIYDGLVNFLLKVIHSFASVDFTFFKSISFTQLEIGLAFVVVFFLGLFLKFRTKKFAFRLVAVVILFFMLRVSLNLKESFIDETRVFHVKKENVLMIRSGRAAEFFVSKANSNLEKFLIEPYVAKTRISDYQINVIPEGTKAIVVNGKQYVINE